MPVKITKSHVVIACATIIILGAAILLGIFLLHRPIKTSSQSDYPTLPAPALADEAETSLSDQVSDSDLIVDATVVKVLPDETRIFKPQRGTAEVQLYAEQGISGSPLQLRPVELKINRVLKGGSGEKNITMYILPMGLDCSPDFKTGDRLVFMLRKYIVGGYSPAELQSGFYHIAADNRVYPAVVNNLLKDQSGRSLSDFENDIRSLARKN